MIFVLFRKPVRNLFFASLFLCIGGLVLLFFRDSQQPSQEFISSPIEQGVHDEVFMEDDFIPLSSEDTSNKGKETENLYEQEELLFQTSDLPLDLLTLPEGFEIHVFANGIEGARSLALGSEGVVYIGSRQPGKVYRVMDRDMDGKADKVEVLAEGLESPNGVAFQDGDLYVAEIHRILRFPDIESQSEPFEYEVLFDEYPKDKSHGWKFIRFSPEGDLYVPVGAPCNVCESKNEVYASLTRFDMAGGYEVIASGIRNTVGFDWHPETKELWFTDNGRDWVSDNIPPDELNRLETEGAHFGFPYCHGRSFLDSEFGDGRSCDEFVPPVQELGPHVAALGMRFYTGTMFPDRYQNQVFIAEHGSWNRTTPIGYQVSLVRLSGTESVGYEPFVSGWLQGDDRWGRPVDVETYFDGSLLVSDDYADTVYRIIYTAQ